MRPRVYRHRKMVGGPLGALLLAALAAGSGCDHKAKGTAGPGSPSPSSAVSWLKDVTDESGLDFVHEVGPIGDYFMPESLGSGVAVFDYDRDGRMDLFFLQNAGTQHAARHRLYHQDSDGRFLDVSAGSGLDITGLGMGVAIGDVDNDGQPDVFITEYERARLFRNLGGGKFEEITVAAGIENPHWGMSAAFFDYDRDGWLDLIVANYVDYSESNACHDPQGRPTYCGPSGFPGTVPRLFRNRGGSSGVIRFEDVTVAAGLGQLAAPGLGVICADVNGDRWQDVLIANDGHMNWLLINQRDGTFVEEGARRGIAYNEMGAVQANMGVALGDVDGDGLFDILITHLSSETHALWMQGPRGLFQDRTGPSRVAASAWRGTGFGTLLPDLNDDGAPDLVVVNGGIKRQAIDSPPLGRASRDSFWEGFEQRSQVFSNDGSGGFSDVSDQNLALSGMAAVARGLAVGDMNNDGGLDLLVTRIAAPARLYRNTARRGHWLSVRVVDPALGGRDAYGSEIRILAGTWRRTGWANPSQSYLCSNDPRTHFGLGPVTRVDRIDVIWPDGREEQFPGADADQSITLQKGLGKGAMVAGLPPATQVLRP